MKLLIDIGNTRVKWALIDQQILVKGDADDWSALEKHKDAIHSAWISCVGNDSIFKKVAKQVREICGIKPFSVKVTSSACGLVNQYKNLERLGVDRWIAAIGARALRPSGELIVIDVGTAVTIDCVDAKSNYLGGVILPGFAMMHDSLVGQTAGISSLRQDTVGVIGKNTQECVNAGAHYGLVGAIERVVSEMQADLGSESMDLLITGGDAGLVIASSHLPFDHQANLLFDGLIAVSECSEYLENGLSSDL